MGWQSHAREKLQKRSLPEGDSSLPLERKEKKRKGKKKKRRKGRKRKIDHNSRGSKRTFPDPLFLQ